MHSPTAFAMGDRKVARKNGRPVLISAAQPAGFDDCLSEGADTRSPAIFGERA
jgi:hypothetical protein